MQERKHSNNNMSHFTIKKHTDEFLPKKPHLYALSKGFNAGKPSWKPSTNCFVIICESETDKQKIFFILDGIWSCQIFRRQMHGSVIPMLYPHELAATLTRYWNHIHESEQRMTRLIEVFDAMQKLQSEINQLSQILESYKPIAYKDILKIQDTTF
jgi:hypothetical protein